MQDKKRKICVLVLNRSEYSRLKPLIKVLISDDRIELSIVTLKSRYANNEILFKNDNLPLTHVINLDIKARELSEMPKAIGRLLEKFGDLFHRNKPDAVVIHGDRYEAIAAALAATFNNIYIAHLQGGEVTGTADEHIRHAITKLAHLHLTSTIEARNRIIKLGEPEESVINTGCPGVDLLLNTPAFSFLELRYELYKSANNRIEILEKFRDDYMLVMQSSVTTEDDKAEDQIIATLKALDNFKETKVIMLPNPDAGGDKIEREIKKFVSKRNDFIIFKHFPPELFVNLMRNTRVMVGNSSAGIRETGYFGVPTVNIGTRQIGRERSENIIDVGNDEKEITAAIRKQLEHGPYKPERIYGEGNAAAKIAEILSSVDFSKIQKQITY
ncbi:MAG: UDP-N-acetylglucosamine 2-epimerase [Microgenomates group bacterium GW2011_GWC1_37_8]|uniref:UDP-N-acetyl-D-glucosamine 2-epimerase, UDP-hydrolysing n=1 Tax=Candidatus Zambryskibacteria bacterium RIFCSPHIGHO2_01_FULL_46_25 TaxID=1802738 RepID=A0A1G2SZQ3_9BACT|nr:MAG: UDP-N-acetylglucosamine 2-epimerase [Microgenomates group bacterium GW2011_GWC1_37_8]OHA90527.1 MAG: UDP-N-acetyl-D-glucosamine 2-epimerase, UDP-hydrolysing [Candidatus Zambryskibacteria bacterium RIFCSPHIGHO2_01_FULL_46_25]